MHQLRRARYRRPCLGVLAFLMVLGGHLPASAQEEKEGERDAAAELQAKLQDPLSTLAAVVADNKAYFRAGEDNDEAYVVALQPVYSLPFEDQGFILIPRMNIPIISLKPGLDVPRLSQDGSVVQRDKGRETGLSDIAVQLFATPAGVDLYGWKFGGGPQFSFNTRTDTDLKGAGYGAGPAFVAVGGIGENVSVAALVSHMWGFDGDFSTLSFQPMLFYNLPPLPGLEAPAIFYNNTIAFDFKAKGSRGQSWTVPIGIGAGNTFVIGDQGYGFDVGLGYYYQPSFGRPKGGPEHQLQLTLTLVFPHKKFW